jgi:hypothetical protein
MLLGFLSCQLKTKTELYLEMGLKHLDNTVELNETLYDSIFVERIGVIRDKKLGKLDLVIKLDHVVSQNYLEPYNIGVRTYTLEEKIKKIETWSFHPKILLVKDHVYIVSELMTNNIMIDSIYLYLYQKADENKRDGNLLKIYRLRTNND